MANYEIIEVNLKESGFSYFVVKFPEDVIEDKLALASTETGHMCRMEYQNFLLREFVLNLERLFMFMAETTGGDVEEQLSLRSKIEETIYKVNPLLKPENIVITGSGVLKPFSKGKGTILVDNPDWPKIIQEINPFVAIEEVEIIDDPRELVPTSNEEPYYFDRVDIVKRKWKRTGLELKIKAYSRDDLPKIFGPELVFNKPMHYKVHIIQKCIEDAENLFIVVDSMGITDNGRLIPTLTEELYQICIDINPFLKAGEIDLDEIDYGKVGKSKNREKERKERFKREVSRTFESVTKKELLSLGDRIKNKVIGQDNAIDQVIGTIKIASCGLRDPEKPIASYLLCGTTGTGKTLLAKVLAEELCGSKENAVIIDCSEFTQPHDVYKLIGTNPGYVGFEEGGFLTNAIQENPFSIILFDEIEKANDKFFDILLQLLDEARLTDGKGNVTRFNDCVVLMTSNIGVVESEAIEGTIGFGDAHLLTQEKRKGVLEKALKKRFRPEFLNRMDNTIPFRQLEKKDVLKIIDLMLDKVAMYLRNKRITADFTDNLREMVFDRGFSKRFGARSLQRTVDKEIVRCLAEKILKEEIKESARIRVDYKKDKIQVRLLKSKIPVKRQKGLVKKKIIEVTSTE